MCTSELTNNGSMSRHVPPMNIAGTQFLEAIREGREGGG